MNERLKRLISQLWPYLLLACLSLFLLNLQFQLRVTPIVGDSYFHYSRFYDAAMQLRHWNFSYFQTNYGFDQSGRMVNAMYGPLFAYAMGLLLLLTHTWFRFKLVSAFLISWLGTSGMYHLSLKATKRQGISFFVAAAYLGVSNLTLWQSVSNFRAVSAMLAPYVMMCAWRMIADRQRPINWVQLGVTMAIVGQVHLLSCLIFTLALIPFFVASLVKASHQKRIWLNFAGSIGLAALLTMNVWLVLLHFFTAEKIFTPDAMNVAWSSLRLVEVPSLISLPTTLTFVSLSLVNGLYLLFNFKEDWLNNIVFIVGFIIFLMSTNLFPWGFIQSKLPVLQTTFQNPRRLLITSDPLLLLSLGLTASHLTVKSPERSLIKPLMICLLGLMSFGSLVKSTNLSTYYAFSARTMKDIDRAARSRDLSLLFKYAKNLPASDYLPKNEAVSNDRAQSLYQAEVINRKQIFGHQVLPGGKLKLTWVNHRRKAKTRLPIVMYHQSQLQSKDKLLSRNAIGAPLVRSRRGENAAILSFQQPGWFSFNLAIVLLSWVVIVAYLIVKAIINRRKGARKEGLTYANA